MANNENLKPFTSDQNREEAAKNGRKGGKASGKARREKRAMKEQLQELLALPVVGADAKALLAEMGIKPDDANYQTAMLVAMVKKVLEEGNVSAFTAIRDTIGEMPVMTQNLNVNQNPFEGLSTEELKAMIGE